MPPLTPARRFALIVAAVTGGMIVAMIVETMLARRGFEFTGALRSGSVRLNAALAWWAVTGAAFVASFIIAAVISREIWHALGSLRSVAVAPVVLALAGIGDLAPLSAPGAAVAHAIAILTALLAALLMAWFGAFFAMRH